MFTSVADHGPFLSGSVGPNSDTMGVPTAAAMCKGPVSPDTISDAARHSSTRSARRVDDCAPQRFLMGSPQHERDVSSDLAQEGGDFAEAFRRPAFVRPRGAGIEQGDRRPRSVLTHREGGI